MKKCTVAIGADHRGALFKAMLIKQLRSCGDIALAWIDVGCSPEEKSCEYPTFSRLVCKAVHEKRADLGVLLCGTGVGMAIAANRFAGIYAALCWETPIAAQARAHDWANILVVPADYVDESLVVTMVQTFITTIPLADYHANRIAAIDSWGGLTP